MGRGKSLIFDKDEGVHSQGSHYIAREQYQLVDVPVSDIPEERLVMKHLFQCAPIVMKIGPCALRSVSLLLWNCSHCWLDRQPVKQL